MDPPYHNVHPGRLERLFGGLLPRYADIGEQTVIKLQKLSALVPFFPSR
jgi:hypothetical protein